MSDEYEYVDEDGNPIDPSELGDDVEIVEEVVEYDQTNDDIDVLDLDFEVDDDDVPDAPLDGESAPASVEPVEPVVLDKEPVLVSMPATVAAPEETPEPVTSMPSLSGRGKLALAGAGVAVVTVLGVAVFGLSALGNQNTVDDIKAAGESQYARASSAVASKSSEVRGEVASEAIDTCRTGKLSAGGGLGDAMSDGAEAPKLRLDVISATPLPGPFIAARTNADGKTGTPSLLQLTKQQWGIYTTVPLTKAEQKAETDRPGFHKADVQVTDDAIRVTGDRIWAGGDSGGAGSCEPGEPGVYAASGRVPTDAQGLVDGQAQVDAIQGVAGRPDTAVAIMGNSIVLTKLVEAPAEGGEAGESGKPSK